MSRPNPIKVAGVLALILIVSSLSVPLKGGLYLSNFEGDALHLADIVLRMAGGERPHLDFMTPIGVLAFAPIALFLGLGMTLGLAYALGQALVALILLPMIWRAAVSRLPPVTGWAFGIITVLLVTSLAHGDDRGITAVSMHYNRWAWAIAFVATVLAVLPPRNTPMPRIDGALVGVLLVGLALLKITYLVTFAPVLIVAVLLRRDVQMLVFGLIAGVIAAALAAVVLGPTFVLAYFGDVISVTNAPLRNAPGLSLADIAISPPYIAATLTLLVGALALRRYGRQAEGLSILLLYPVFLVVTWQNHGNDPLWLIMLCVLFAALWDADRRLMGVGLAGVAAFVLAVPGIAVHGLSGIRHMTLSPASYTQLVPGRDSLADLHIPNLPAHLVRARHVLNEDGAPFAALADRIELPEPVTIGGETLPECQLITGIKGTMELVAGDLPEGSTYVADVISSYWLYTDQTPPPQAAPWNYGTDHGLIDQQGGARLATTLLVPLCPINVGAQREILKLFEGREIELIQRSDRALLFQL